MAGAYVAVDYEIEPNLITLGDGGHPIFGMTALIAADVGGLEMDVVGLTRARFGRG